MKPLTKRMLADLKSAAKRPDGKLPFDAYERNTKGLKSRGLVDGNRAITPAGMNLLKLTRN